MKLFSCVQFSFFDLCMIFAGIQRKNNNNKINNPHLSTRFWLITHQRLSSKYFAARIFFILHCVILTITYCWFMSFSSNVIHDFYSTFFTVIHCIVGVAETLAGFPIPLLPAAIDWRWIGKSLFFCFLSKWVRTRSDWSNWHQRFRHYLLHIADYFRRHQFFSDQPNTSVMWIWFFFFLFYIWFSVPVLYTESVDERGILYILK